MFRHENTCQVRLLQIYHARMWVKLPFIGKRSFLFLDFENALMLRPMKYTI